MPENTYKSSIKPTDFGSTAAHAPGLPDKLKNQQGPGNLSSKINNLHPLENRIQNWETTELNTRLETYRRVFGAGEPIKRTMELNIVNNDFRPSVLGGPDPLHRDILLNKDTSIDWEDVYKPESTVGFHDEIEADLL